MLRELVKWVLNTYLSNYVENLSIDQLSVALLQGEVELENVPLRKDALRHLGLPVEIRSGLIGRVKLQIPVRQIRTAPWVIIFEQLYLVAGPYKQDEFDAKLEEQSRQDYKLRRLDTLEAMWRAEHQAETGASTSFYSSSCSSWVSYTSGLVTNIVENLQLKIRDVHIRYEDNTTVPGCSLAAGLTLRALSAQTCDSKWMPGYVPIDSASEAFKLVELTDAAIYWDTQATMLGDLPLAELAIAMQPSQLAKRPDSFMLSPVSAQARLKRNRSEQPLRLRTQPRVVCDMILDSMLLSISDVQYGQMVNLLRGLDALSLEREASIYQSSCPHTDAKSLWRWAAYHAYTLSKVSKLYIDLYTQYLLTPNTISTENKQLKDTIELRYEYEILKELREISMQHATSKITEDIQSKGWNVPGRGLLVQWFPLWTGWYSSPTTQQEPMLRSPDDSQILEDELLHALSDSVESTSLLRRDAVFSVATLTLKQGSFRLFSSTKPADPVEEDERETKGTPRYPIMEVELESLKLQLELRPRLNSKSFSFSVGGIYLRDCLTRNSLFPMVVEPQQLSKETRPRNTSTPINRTSEPLFKLLYEVKPFSSKVDYRLHIESRSLTVVYNPNVVKAITEFFTRPQNLTQKEPAWHLGQAARFRYETMKRKTKERILQNWEEILEGDHRNRSKWDIKLNISAPQIVFAENFCDKSATVVLVDFGKLNVRNLQDDIAPSIMVSPARQESEEDDECFHTPCSSPQTEQVYEESKSPTFLSPKHDHVTEIALHQKMYDRFSIELGDMQILVGRTRDNIKHAHLKGTSTLHVLDRFNISIQLERRALYSNDPSLPSLKLSGNLPKLVVHVNEQKVAAIRSMIYHICGEGLPSPFRPQESSPIHQKYEESDQQSTPEPFREISENACLFVLRFCIDDMSLEVQSRGRCVAELQVKGVKAGTVKRPYETSASLSIHSLLLVDAMQTYGNDFDLLVASHQRVGMDSVSGSLFDSEPTSPTSPASPDPLRGLGKTTSPIALTQALSSLQFTRAVSPAPVLPHHVQDFDPPDSEALISIELVLLGPGCPSLEEGEESKHIATVHFNYLDIIANQETIVELVGFVKRLFPESKSYSSSNRFIGGSSIDNLTTEPMAKIEIMFDFQRLNVLLLRAVVKDNITQARKIATATLTEAKIQATVGNDLVVKGSLGGLQVLDLTPEGQKHQRILSLGHDPLVNLTQDHHTELLNRLTAELSCMYQHSASPGAFRQDSDEDEKEAFSFTIIRPLDEETTENTAEINMRMASVWYTHSPQFLEEIQSCATEFKQYITNLARSIRSAATEMAMGLVHARAEALAERLYSSRGSLAGPSLDMSPQRRRRRSMSQSLEFLESKFNTPYTPDEDNSNTDYIMDMKIDIVLESPVIVLPRSQTSSDVFVAHLGKITLNDQQNQDELPSNVVSPDSDSHSHYCWGIVRRRAKYNLEIRDMNLSSLNVETRRKQPDLQLECPLQRADVLYSCDHDAYPILHDTLIKLTIELDRGRSVMKPTESLPSLLMDQSMDFLDVDSQDVVQIRGCVVQPLRVSLSRGQYEQLLDCLDQITGGGNPANQCKQGKSEDDKPDTILNIDPNLRARLLGTQPPVTTPLDLKNSKHKFILKVFFELPELKVILRGNLHGIEQNMVEVAFGDFIVRYDKSDPYETSIKMSLRSLVVEDLLQSEVSPHRKLVVSQFVIQEETTLEAIRIPMHASKSCPDLGMQLGGGTLQKRHSLPDRLETSILYGIMKPTTQTQQQMKTSPTGEYPCTPPPSPRNTSSPQDIMSRKDNLVHIDVQLIDPKSPEFFSRHNANQRYVDVNFNCLDLIVNIESWVMILDFFGLGSEQENVEVKKPKIQQQQQLKIDESVNSELEIKVRSLTLVLTRASGGELARANVSQLTAHTEKRGSESSTSGKLGKLSLLDLTPHGRLYRERFTTTGGEALDFHILNYSKPDLELTREFDTQVKLKMSSVHYVHTQRFIEEFKTQFTHFSVLQTLVSKLRAAASGNLGDDQPTRGRRILWDIQAASPVILLPLSSKSNKILVANLGELTVTNKFTLKIQENTTCLIDVMSINLINMDIFSGHRITSLDSLDKSTVLNLGVGTYIEKIGVSYLNEKCHLQLKVERNLDSATCHPVPDLSIHGTLSTLHAVLGLDQYQLVRGLLSYNIGENLDDLEDLLPPTVPVFSQEQIDLTWVFNCLKLDLHNVTVSLQDNQKEPLACINFITCRLVIESRSDGSRDIDLVSKEILLLDTRFNNQPVNKRSNVFTSILQPVDIGKRSSQVQAEIHHRRKLDGTQFTILLNNMRLMLILDWWEIVRDFIFTDPEKQDVATPIKIQQDDLSSRPQTVQENESPFELKLNITDSEVVVVEDTSQWDSNAVILKSTTVISYRPTVKERPLSCNLNRCELFYCILGMEEETALSIIDPVTVNLEIAQRDDLSLGLDVSLHSMRLRLSYHDFRMFSQMLLSLPKQTKEAIRKRDSVTEKTNEKPANVISQINKLRGLGFSPEDCANALDECGGKLDDAALWLTQHATHVEPVKTIHSPEDPPSSSLFNIEAIEIKTNHLSICVIDDCRDADVPILEISLSNLSMCQNLISSDDARTLDKGQMTSVLAVDYYNRILSGWEPMIEPWRCEFIWDWQYLTGKPYFRLQIDAEDLLALNITNSLLQLYSTVKESWTEDYLALTRARSDSQIKAMGYRRRSPFVPFALYNDTGSDLWFTTNVTMADRSYDPLSQDLPSEEGWMMVEKGSTIPFSFEARRLKLRHGNTHEMKLHQLRVRIEGWQTVQPVSVDRVGVYFRHAQPDLAQGNMPSARVVFQVTLEGSAKKLVTVRSALQITNSLTNDVELKMDNRDLQISIVHHQVIKPGTTYAVPLPLVHATLRVRPMLESMDYQHSSQELQWSHLGDPGGISEELYCCRPTNSHSNQDSYRFTLAVRREMYPPEKQYPQWMQHRNLMYMYPQPAHTLILLSPIVVDNLLPLELECSVTTNSQVLRIAPGKSAALNLIDISVPISMQFLLENFTSAGQLELLQYGGASKLSNLFLTDSQGRHLQLTAKVRVVTGKGCKIAISAPYWLLNRTGLPLVFKQEGASLEAAGQGREHEMARMVAPLLFSLADPDHGAGLVVRVGNGVHLNSRSEWSSPLLPRRDVQVRQLRVSMNDDRSDHIYELGISSKPGRGRYRKTTMVHLSPRYLLHNKSSFELQFAQSCLATTVSDPGAEATFLRAVSGCCLPFHWPRLDKEHRLCVRLIDIHECMWSGSFYITKCDTFHLNIRDRSGKMNFILVEVTQQDASFVIIFSDADSMPPPIRIDNFSEVPIFFYQCGARVQQSAVRPHCSVPYALDEPTLPKNLTCIAPGGNEVSFDMNNFKQEKELTYENFIYIALIWTFPKECQDDTRLELQCQQLVLDVPEGQRVVLRRKEQGCRSQLWRMTADGHLQHEGSSPPRDPRKEDRLEYSLVLDISGPAPQPSQYVPLVIRRPDPRRQSTQTWRFTEDGRLCCAHNNMCVQAKDGFFGLRRVSHGLSVGHDAASTWQMWSEAVLGPPQPTCHQLTEDGIPVEQAVSRQRLRPGSGILTLRVVADGPTRALEICDKKAKHTFAMMQQRDWAHLAHTSQPQVLHGVGASSAMLAPSTSRSSDQHQRNSNACASGWEFRLRLVQGLGVSLVDTQAREELAFCLLQGLSVRVTLEQAVQRFDAQVLNIQVDNQMCEAQCPVVVYIPNTGRSDENSSLPVIEISAERVVSEHHNIDTIKHVWLLVRNLSITIEEEQLLLVLALLGLGVPETEPDSTATAAGADGDWEAQRGLTAAAEQRLAAKKYFFSTLLVKPSQIRLGAVTSSKLPPRLKQMRRRLGLVLIKFEDAAVELQPFVVEHAMLSQPALLDHLAKHFQAVVKGQLPIILFSSDILGGPSGLVSNVSEGVIDVLNDPSVRSVGDLVKNVTHGISNSAAKVTGSLSDGLGWVALDETHEEIRQKILKKNAQQNSSFHHLKVGFRSFAFGVLGGATSIFTQTYEGIAVDGPPGLISGLGKGIVGTVTKPVMGALDLASEVASAVRDSSRSSRRVVPCQVRLPRCVVGPGGLLPVYSAKQSQGQRFLHQINNNLFSEIFMAYEHLRCGTEDLRVIVSSEAVRVFTCSSGGSTAVVIKVHLGELQHCRYVRENDPSHPGRPLHYIELAEQVEPVVTNEVLPVSFEPQTRRPRVRCDTEDIAKWVSQQINYAKGMYEEKIRTLISLPELDD